MKNRLSTILTVLALVVLIAGAVCIGAVNGYKNDREELLLECMAMHSEARNLSQSIAECRDKAEDFDNRLEYRFLGRIAGSFGVEPVSSSVEGLHAKLLQEATIVSESPDLLSQLGAQVEELLDDHLDTSLSLGKVFWTVVLLLFIFGKRDKRGITLGKLLAGFGLFRMWRKK